MWEFMLIYSDTEDGTKQYVGTFKTAESALDYAAKNLKDKKWMIGSIYLLAE